MTTRFVKGKARTETPRLKDLSDETVRSAEKSARRPSVGRDRHGHFLPGNPHAIGQGFKAMVRASLGDPDDPQIGEMAKQAARLYLHIVAGLPSDGVVVRQMSAAQARHVVLATHLTNESIKAGIGTDRGLKLAEAARAHDKTAQSLSVAAFDRAVKEAAMKPKHDPYAALLDDEEDELPVHPADPGADEEDPTK
jgi:hypothetical protein